MSAASAKYFSCPLAVHHHDGGLRAVDKGFELLQTTAVVLKRGDGVVQTADLRELQTEIGQGAHDPGAYGHAGHDDDEFVPTIRSVQTVERAQVNQCFARAGFHLHANIDRLALLGRGQMQTLVADAMALGHVADVFFQLIPTQRAAVARQFMHLCFRCAVKHPDHRIDGISLVGQRFKLEVRGSHVSAEK